MPKYLATARFTTPAFQGLRSEGAASRVEVNRRAIESLGGTMEAYYFAFGPFDVVAVIDLPGDEAAAAASLTVNSTGAVHVEITKLLTAEQVDAALAMTPEYRPPGSS